MLPHRRGPSDSPLPDSQSLKSRTVNGPRGPQARQFPFVVLPRIDARLGVPPLRHAPSESES